MKKTKMEMEVMMSQMPPITPPKPKEFISPNSSGFTFGCDPELFVVNQNGGFVSAAGLIPGTKSEPFKVKKGAVQVDGMAAEFNIDPVKTFEEWDDSIVTVMGELQNLLPDGYSLKAVPFVKFSEEEWEKAPPEAKMLGCDPDYNAWTGKKNRPARDADNPTLCVAAGHTHIGFTENADLSDIQHIMNCRDLVKQLDFMLGHDFSSIDTSSVRRRLYGQAGACRYKPYGVEYRVLSNMWVDDRKNRLFVWNRTQMAIAAMKSYYMPTKLSNYSEILVTRINNSRRDSTLGAKISNVVNAFENGALSW